MADIKISDLTAATTPLGGTEVLPIVQSGVTVKVAVSNLTAGRSVSATSVAITGSTSGTATIVTPAVAGTPTITLPIVTGTLATLAGTETLTNKTLTGADMNGTVGATTPSTGAFTTGTFSSTLGVTGTTTLGSTLVVTAAASSLGLVINGRSSDNLGALYYYANNGTTNYATITTSASEFRLSAVPAAAVQTFYTNGAERMRITDAGLVGIGTNAPGVNLDVLGTDGVRIKYGAGLGLLMSQVSSGGSVAINNQANAALIFATNNTNQVYLTAAGRVGIGTGATVNYALEVSTDSAGKPGVGGLWTVVSDERIKSDIVPANLDRCYEIVKSVPLKYFGFAPGVYTDDQIQDKHNLGWIAQDVQKVFKNAVSVKPFTLKTDIPDGVEEYEEQDFTLESVEKTETSIQVINGKAVQVSKVVKSDNKILLFDTVDVVDEAGAAVMVDDKPLTYQMPRMITKTRPKVRHDVIEDCLDLNGAQMLAALYGAVQALMKKIEKLENL